MNVRSIVLAACCLPILGLPAHSQPARPTESMVDPARCQWEWKEGGGIGVWAERCALATGVWELKFDESLPGFVLTVDGKPGEAVIQLFRKPAGADIPAVLPSLRAQGAIPDDDLCVFAPAAIRPAPRTIAFFDIQPTGARKAAFEAAPSDEVPEPPCGAYGWSTHGLRYFMTDIRHPDSVLYLNEGQDGMMFDPKTVTIE